jgi:DNA-binding MarR family transcriptional regulator
MSSPNADPSSSPPLAMLVGATFDHLVGGLHKALPAAGFPDIRPAHCTGVFRVIDAEGTRPGELARRAGVTPQAMAEFVRYLEGRGYVERVPDATDRRGRIVKLTARGRQASAAAGQAFAAIEASWEQQLGKRRMAQLRKMLAELANLEP